MKTNGLTALQRAAVALTGGVTLLLGLYGALFSFFSCFPLLLDEKALFWPGVWATLGAVAVFSLPKRWMRRTLSGLWLAGLGWTVWTRFSELVAGALSAAERVGGVFAKRIGRGLVAPDFSAQIGKLSLAEERAACTLLCVLVLVLLALGLGWAAVGRKSFWLSLLFTAPFVIAPITITITPAWAPLFAVLLFWLVRLLTRLVARGDPWGGAKTTFVALPAGAALLLALALVLPMEEHKTAAWVDEARTAARDRVSFAAGQLLASAPVSGLSGPVGGSVEVRLDRAGPLRFNGSAMLRVESEFTGHLYLRGFSAATYTGTNWEQLTEKDYEEMRAGWAREVTTFSSGSVFSASQTTLLAEFPGIGDLYQPLNFPALADGAGGSRRFTIESLGGGGPYVYTPYQLSTTPENMMGAAFLGDAYLARDAGIRRYVLYARPGASPETAEGLTGATAEAERAYRDFVDEYYTRVPDELRETLVGLLLEAGFSDLLGAPVPDDPSGYAYPVFRRISTDARIDLAQQIGDYLGQIAVYNPSTPVTPQGEDFVDYFLTTSKQGYCMHFASAATLLLRTLGVPARYVTGYTADAVEGQAVTVPDRNAHAWVEIYLDGYGWHPIEATPGAAVEVFAPETPAPKPTHTPGQTPGQVETPRPTPTYAPSASGGGEGSGEVDIDWTRLFDPVWLIPPIALMLAAWLFRLRYEHAANRRRKRFYQSDVNRAVIEMYVYSEKLLRAHKGEVMNPLPEALGQKARFSRHTLTEDERAQMLSYTTGLAVRTHYLLGRWRRAFWRYVLGRC